MTFKQEMERLMKAQAIAKYDHTTEENYEHIWGSMATFKMRQSAAGTEKAIVKYLQLNGHHAAKVEVKGTYVAPEWEASTMGRVQTKKGMYLPSGARKGSADISASMHGVAVFIEVKFSDSDRQSADQKRFEADVVAAGGIYIITRNVDQFLEQYKWLIDHPRIALMRDYELKNPTK